MRDFFSVIRLSCSRMKKKLGEKFFFTLPPGQRVFWQWLGSLEKKNWGGDEFFFDTPLTFLTPPNFQFLHKTLLGGINEIIKFISNPPRGVWVKIQHPP